MKPAGRPIALLFVFAVIAACAAVATQPACADIPFKTCQGAAVNFLAEDAGGDQRARDCTACLQRPECCDELGACADNTACAQEFKDMQRCMIERGPAFEKDCLQLLKSPAGVALHACVREPCGKSCGIPSCNLNAATTLFLNADCDKCVTGACCEQINACYGNRQCKLFLECITDHCPSSTGASLSRVGAQTPELIDAFEYALCGDAGAFAVLQQANQQGDRFDPGPCLTRCLNEFAAPEGGLAEENRAANCLAVGVYTCGGRNACGPRCRLQGTASGAYPEDDSGVADAGTD